MEIYHGREEIPADFTSVVTLGNFDGVHLGHQRLLGHTVQAARRARARAVALTFDPHPLHVHRPELALPLITSLPDRLEAIAATGIDATVVVDYTLRFAAQTPRDFVTHWLVECLGMQRIVVGEDMRFGAENAGCLSDLEALGGELGFAVDVLPDVGGPSGRRWSSTWVRELLAAGDVAGAGQILGRAHRVRGTVIRGAARGRTLGFPTANLDADTVGVVPPDGVYAGWLVRADAHAVPERLPAAISIGTNPTFDDIARTVEAHVLGRADLNLYGQEVVVELTHRLRPMLSFADVGELLAQMRTDVEQTAALLGVPTPAPINPAEVTAQPA